MTLMFWRFVISVIIIGAMLLINRQSFVLEKPWRFSAFMLGLIWSGSMIFYLKSVETISVSLAVLILYSYPILVLLVSMMSGKTRVSRFTIGVFLLAFAGIALMLGGWQYFSEYDRHPVCISGSLRRSLHFHFRQSCRLKDQSRGIDILGQCNWPDTDHAFDTQSVSNAGLAGWPGFPGGRYIMLCRCDTRAVSGAGSDSRSKSCFYLQSRAICIYHARRHHSQRKPVNHTMGWRCNCTDRTVSVRGKDRKSLKPTEVGTIPDKRIIRCGYPKAHCMH